MKKVVKFAQQYIGDANNIDQIFKLVISVYKSGS
jgi:hypothetical protein